MFNLIKKISFIYKGKSIARILLNDSFVGIKIKGNVLDVGGARNPDYFNFFDTTFLESKEILDGKTHKIDFEKDIFPFEANHFKTIICANVLEHIYNYKFLVSEIYRTLKEGGELIGFVPFLIQYHPDPHDYFRYTKESLHRIFAEAGFSEIRVVSVGQGPLMVNFNNIMFTIPRIFRPIFYCFYVLIAKISLIIKPEFKDRYPVGFTFICKK